MNGTSRLYNAVGTAAALAVRTGAAPAARAALLAARERTLALDDAWERGLGAAYPRVPYAAELNPPLWELGHIGWFQEWWVARNPQRARGWRCDPDLPRPPSLLPGADAWYDSSRVAHRSRWCLPLPDAAATRDYLARTLAGTLELLAALPAGADHDQLYFFRLAALHEEMHAEAAVYMAARLGFPLPLATPALAAPEELAVPAQEFSLGSEPTRGFAFDNELQPHTVALAAFRIDTQPVSWARYLPFVRAGGYQQPRWWSEAGRAWLALARPAREAAALPPQQAATHLTAYEAEAWCAWAGRRLPTEAEWECAALTAPGFDWGQAWEWTASTFEPYPGFEPHPYRDYSAPWFGTRRVLRGASPATPPALRHARYRNFFEPGRGDILAGFRTCAS